MGATLKRDAGRCLLREYMFMAFRYAMASLSATYRSH